MPFCHQKKVLIWCLKNPWELALKPEEKYSVTLLLSTPIILQCKRGGNKSLYVHTDLLQPLNVLAIVINQKFKIKQKPPFLQLRLKIKASGLAFQQNLQVSRLTIQYTKSVQFCFGDFGGGREEGRKWMIPSARWVVNRSKGAFHTLPWQSSYWNWKIVTQREDKREFYHSN